MKGKDNSVETDKRPLAIRDMFSRIAEDYDLMNTIMTFGMERSWKREVARLAFSPRGRVLDIGTGTGTLAAKLKSLSPFLEVVATDFSAAMIKKGRAARREKDIFWVLGDALKLPFHDESFDAVTSAYLIRNVQHPLSALREQFRVLRPGGRLVCLETSPPGRGVIPAIARSYTEKIIPLLGGLVAGHREAYAYLGKSTSEFMRPEELSAVMAEAGFEKISFRPLMLRTQMIHVAFRPHET